MASSRRSFLTDFIAIMCIIPTLDLEAVEAEIAMGWQNEPDGKGWYWVSCPAFNPLPRVAYYGGGHFVCVIDDGGESARLNMNLIKAWQKLAFPEHPKAA